VLPDAEAEFSADEKEGYLIMESDALEDDRSDTSRTSICKTSRTSTCWFSYRTSADDRGAMAFLKSSHGRSADL